MKRSREESEGKKVIDVSEDESSDVELVKSEPADFSSPAKSTRSRTRGSSTPSKPSDAPRSKKARTGEAVKTSRKVTDDPSAAARAEAIKSPPPLTRVVVAAMSSDALNSTGSASSKSTIL